MDAKASKLEEGAESPLELAARLIAQIRASDAPAKKSAEEEPLPLPADLKESTIDFLYQSAYELYQGRRHKQATALFRLLTLFREREGKHWFGLAAALQAQGLVDEALPAYAMCALLDPENAWPHLHAAECYFKQSNLEEALQGLEQAKGLSHGNEALQMRIELFMQTCHNERPIQKE
ncbi:MAG: scc2-A [Chlamydiales bacterium]|nr:scc2-A [Chlamydiales bacterium]